MIVVCDINVMNFLFLFNIVIFVVLLIVLGCVNVNWSLVKCVLLGMVLGIVFGLVLYLIYGDDSVMFK